MSKLFSNAKEVEQHHIAIGFTEKFCQVPFTTLLLEPDGLVGACRHKGSEFPVGNILENTFEEIWNGEFIQNWRQEFLDGKPKICATESKYIKCNHCPEYNTLLPKAEFAVRQKKKPARLAFNFNGHCNLECNMCHIWQKPNGLYDKIGFWEKLDFWIEDLEEIEMLAGEPFIQKDTYKLIDLVSQKKPQTQWTLTTNANWVLSDYIKAKLDLIQVKNIIISLDATEAETYSRIRLKGNFEKALNTTRALQKYEQERLAKDLSPLNIKINFLIQKENWKNLIHFSAFCEKENLSSFRTFLYVPSELSLLTMPEAERLFILETYFTEMNADDIKKNMPVIRPLLDSLKPVDKFYFYEKLHAS